MHFKKRAGRRISALSLCAVLAASALSPLSGIVVHAEENMQTEGKTGQGAGGDSLRLYYDEPAPITGIDNTSRDTDTGFEEYSLPLGCGYMGVNVWGGTETEAVYVTENSLANPYQKNAGNNSTSNRTGLNLLAKTWIDFGHDEEKVSDYSRDLVLDDATAHVSYEYDGVSYSREYFTSYPDKVMVMKLDASEEGALSFTLRPEAPYLCDYYLEPGDGMGKSGSVEASVDGDEGTIVLSGTMEYYQINYEGQYRVLPQGGTMQAVTDDEGNGQIRVEGADSALILLAVGTNYEMTPETFLNSVKEKLDPDSYPHEKVTGYLDEAEKYDFEELRERHVEDYQTYFSRVDLNIGGVDEGKTTDQLLSEYKKGTYSPYLEEVFFQYGRYLLIASSREGCLPANLQGIWNAYEDTPWSGGYWHNINVQMNYWPAFVTNMPELFQSYSDFNEAFRKQAEGNADSYLTTTGSALKAPDGTGENGWAIGTGVYPYTAGAPSPGGHSGPGTGAFTSMLFWDWYDFTRDEEILEEHTYPAVAGMAKFLSKSLIEQDGNYLISPSASPENANNKQTVGCAFDQQMTWENHNNLIKAAEILGKEDDPIVQTAKEQIDKLDPVNIGYSGQVKEYREENYYGEFGESQHRHISQLVGLYPGTSISHNTPAWLDAAKVSLEKRGLGSTGWSIAHRLCAWARIGDGDVCYKEIQQLLKTKIMDNLWDTHPPFQIDGNFGATAGIGEMLLQSHEGYIAPLAALPSAWADGSYEGLLARGNFVVDAKWADGTATEFTITAQSGGSCTVDYPGLADADVRTADGNAVSVVRDGQDRITFDTEKDQSYVITQIPTVKDPKAPSGLKAESTAEGMGLTWTESPDAVSYRVYEAVNDAPDYTLVAENVKGNEYLYAAEDMTEMKAEDRVTMRVTAVSADGRESDGAAIQILPITAPDAVNGYMISDTTLQLVISEVDGADGYVVYKQDGDNWERLYQSEYTTVYVEKEAGAVYAVSAVSGGRESGMTEAVVRSSAELDNILLNKPITITSGQTVHASYPAGLAVNGKADPSNSSDRLALNGDKKGSWTMEIDLEGTYTLNTLSIVEWKNGEGKTRSKNTTVEIQTPGGSWETVESGFACVWNGTKEVDMQQKEAVKIRITFNNEGDPAKYASITEVMCSAVMPKQADKLELFQELQEISGLDLNQYVLSDERRELQEAQSQGAALLQDISADQETVDACAKRIRDAKEAFEEKGATVNIMLGRSIEASADSQNESRYPIKAMVDGDSSTRYAGNDLQNHLTVTVELDGVYKIDTLYVQEFLEKNDGYKTRGDETTIAALCDGEWITLVDKKPLKSEPDRDGQSQSTNIFVLEDAVNASAVRYEFKNTDASKRITIFELQASGERLPSVKEIDGIPGITVKEGTLFEDLSLPEQITAVLDNGTSKDLPVKWQKDGYQADVPGEYILSGVIETGDDILNPQNIKASVTVTVASSVWEQLDNLIAAAQEKDPEDYTQESFHALQKALDAALEVKNALKPNDQDAKKATEALEEALSQLVRDTDKSVLREYLETAENILDNEMKNHYTSESWKALEDAYEEAVLAYADKDADQAAADQAAADLKDCLDGLEKRTEIIALEELVQKAGELEKDLYTEESWNEMTAALNAARAVLLSTDADEKEVKDAAQALDTAIKALQEAEQPQKPDKTALEESVQKAEGLDRTKYTEASWNKLQNALDAARAVLADPDAVQADYDSAQKDLDEAVGALEILPDGPEEPGDVDNPGTSGSIHGGGTIDGTGSGSQGAVKTGDPVQTGGILALAAGVCAAALAAGTWKKKRNS